ncbi:hypothetical protein [Virgibacillus sp. JSM 102003]|uniref:AbiU2 domain-containing protein n=1 Tax=Virgibacillus sp. JSM 102003 TaxID=1562108 RepID=UPI0035BFD4F7
MSNDIVKQFVNDVEGLLEELYQLNSFYLLNKYLKQKSNQEDNLNAMNKAPAFFNLTIHSFQYSSIMGLAKIFEPASRDSKSINNFLNFVESNHKKIFLNDSTTKKKLGRTLNIDESTIIKHKEKLCEVEPIVKNLLSWRDKSFAHNDKRYFKDREALGRDFPITYKEIENLIQLAAEILNTYQVGYNGNSTHIIPSNTYDVDKVINALRTI